MGVHWSSCTLTYIKLGLEEQDSNTSVTRSYISRMEPASARGSTSQA